MIERRDINSYRLICADLLDYHAQHPHTAAEAEASAWVARELRAQVLQSERSGGDVAEGNFLLTDKIP